MSGPVCCPGPESLPVRRAILDDAVHRFENADEADEDATAAVASVVAAADALADAVDEKELAIFFGTNEPRVTRAEKKRAKDMEDAREALRNALLARALALSTLDASDAFDPAVADLERWMPDDKAAANDADKNSYALVFARRDAKRGRPGAALATLRDRLKKAPNVKDLLLEKIHLLERLALDHWATHAKQDLAKKFPKAKSPPL